MRIAIVTGASRGLGAAILAGCERRFDHVIAIARSFHERDKWPQDRVTYLSLDLGDRDERLVHCLRKSWPEQTTSAVFFSNAGIMGTIGQAAEVPVASLEAAIAVNAIAPAKIVRFLLERFRDDPGSLTLVNISSGAAERPIAGWSSYCASKAAALRFFECVALEQPDLKVHNIDPGVMHTDMQAQIRQASQREMPDLEQFRMLLENGRLSDPREVAERLFSEVLSA